MGYDGLCRSCVEVIFTMLLSLLTRGFVEGREGGGDEGEEAGDVIHCFW